MSVDTLRPRVRRFADSAANRVSNWMLMAERDAEALQSNLISVVGVYARSAALLAANWYNQQDNESDYRAFLDVDMPEAKLANVTGWVFKGPQLPENRARVAAQRLVFDAARRTVFVNAATEGVAIARHEQAKCCNQCISRATLTARDRNSSSEDVDQDFHPGCEGMFVPVRGELYAPPDHTREWRKRVELARNAGNTAPEDIANWLSAH